MPVRLQRLLIDVVAEEVRIVVLDDGVQLRIVDHVEQHLGRNLVALAQALRTIRRQKRHSHQAIRVDLEAGGYQKSGQADQRIAEPDVGLLRRRRLDVVAVAVVVADVVARRHRQLVAVEEVVVERRGARMAVLGVHCVRPSKSVRFRVGFWNFFFVHFYGIT